MKTTRRSFVKRMFAGLFIVGLGIKNVFVQGKSKILSDSMPSVKSPKDIDMPSYQLITVTFSDGSELKFYGWIDMKSNHIAVTPFERKEAEFIKKG